MAVCVSNSSTQAASSKGCPAMDCELPSRFGQELIAHQLTHVIQQGYVGR